MNQRNFQYTKQLNHLSASLSMTALQDIEQSSLLSVTFPYSYLQFVFQYYQDLFNTSKSTLISFEGNKSYHTIARKIMLKIVVFDNLAQI